MVESQLREASHLYVDESIRKHGSLPVPNPVARAFEKVSRVTPGHFTLHYVNDPEFNAFSVPSGDIVVNRGLYEKANGNEAAIAMVIGHELAHVVRKHSLNRAVKAAIADAALYALLSNSRSNQAAFRLAFAALLSRFSRDDESEADRFGFVYAMQAGYDPEGALDAIALVRKEGDENTEFLSSHPGGRVRYENVEEFVQAYRKGVPLEFIRYGKLDKDLEKGIGEVPSLELFNDSTLTVLVNAPPSAYTMAIHPRFQVVSQDEGFLSVLVRAPDGGISCLFPNKFAPDGACLPGKPIDIPSYAYRSKKQDLIRLRWDRRGDHQYLFLLSDKPVNWSSVVGRSLKENEFKDSLLEIAESQGSRVLAYGCETLSVR